MITAEEVREIWDAKEKENILQEIKLIEDTIKEACRKHIYGVTVRRPLYPETIRLLKKNNYKVKHKLGFWGCGIDPRWEITW